MIAGFPAQKMVFLPKGAPQEAIDAYTDAFNALLAREDFGALSGATLGIYPQMTDPAARSTLKLGTEVKASAKDYVQAGLDERYGVELK